MFETPLEIAAKIGAGVKARRIALGITQADAAQRAGISYRTWRRLEAEGKASIEDLAKAAIALRCEEGLDQLFSEPPASSMDELLAQQQKSAKPKRRLRAPSRQHVP